MDPTGTDAVESATPPTPPENSPASSNTEGSRLEKVLPEIRELAQKVGGFANLAEIARELGAAGK
jgi:hypothetical protein